MLTDAQWAVLEPLIKAVRPPAKVPLRHLRRTISAILWRHDNARRRGDLIPDALLAHFAPLGWQHLNLTGDYL